MNIRVLSVIQNLYTVSESFTTVETVHAPSFLDDSPILGSENDSFLMINAIKVALSISKTEHAPSLHRSNAFEG